MPKFQNHLLIPPEHPAGHITGNAKHNSAATAQSLTPLGIYSAKPQAENTLQKHRLLATAII
jgi:hypothetical protein